VKVLYFTRNDSVHDRRFLSTMTLAGIEVFLLRLYSESGPLLGLPKTVKEVRWQDKPSMEPRRIHDRVAELQRIIQETQPDLIHAGPLTDCAYLAARSGFQPLVNMSWGSDILAAGGWNFRNKKTVQRTLEHSTVLIGDCEAVKQRAIALGFPADRIVIFPWGIDLKHFSPGSGGDLRKKWGYDKKFVILSLRSWEPIYGVDIAVKAFIVAARQNPALRLLLGGTGAQEEKIRKVVCESGVEDKIRFLGQIPQTELPEIYRGSDLYVSASHSDGSSVTLMEALACGKPVLVSDIPGNKEWVTGGQNGWLFRDNNIHQMATLMGSVQMELTLLDKMATNNRQLAVEKADWKKNSKGLIRAYDMAMKLKGSE
jgi:glycosyltransferase involved in cell wall biosynthesis